MKRLILAVLMLLFVVMPVFGQDVEPTQEIAPAAPELVVDEGLLDFSSPIVWGGWLLAVLFGGGMLVLTRQLASQGNKSAELGLRFFEASRDMLPVEKWQYQFEAVASETDTPIDDYIAMATNAILGQLGLLEPKSVPPAPAGVPDDIGS